MHANCNVAHVGVHGIVPVRAGILVHGLTNDQIFFHQGCNNSNTLAMISNIVRTSSCIKALLRSGQALQADPRSPVSYSIVRASGCAADHVDQVVFWVSCYVQNFGAQPVPWLFNAAAGQLTFSGHWYSSS